MLSMNSVHVSAVRALQSGECLKYKAGLFLWWSHNNMKSHDQLNEGSPLPVSSSKRSSPSAASSLVWNKSGGEGYTNIHVNKSNTWFCFHRDVTFICFRSSMVSAGVSIDVSTGLKQQIYINKVSERENHQKIWVLPSLKHMTSGDVCLSESFCVRFIFCLLFLLQPSLGTSAISDWINIQHYFIQEKREYTIVCVDKDSVLCN